MISPMKWVGSQIGPSGDYDDSHSKIAGLRRAGLGETAVGAGAGAALGAAAGFGLGMHNLLNDRVELTTQRLEVLRPQLDGATYSSGWTQMIPTSDGNGGTGMDYIHHPDDWSAEISQQPTGLTYDRQEFRHSAGLGPVGGTLLGLGAGALLGGVIGALVGALRPESPDSPSSNGEKAPLVGLAAGGVLGAAAGTWAGIASQARNQSITQVIREPIFENRQIGWLPRTSDYSEVKPEFTPGTTRLDYSTTRFGPEPFAGRTPVNASVPTGEFHEQTVTTHSHPLTPLSGALIGAGTGALAGVLAGVAAGIVAKELAQD